MKNNSGKRGFVRRAGGAASSVLGVFQRQKQSPPPQIAVPQHYQSTADTANWMGHLAQHCPSSITLRDVVIPGTHDSASDSIQGLFAGMGRTQSTTVREQLERGARYLDIRVATASSTSSEGEDETDSDLSIWHGFLEGGSFVSVVDDIHGFLKAHPTEIVILELAPEFGRAFTGPMRRKCLDLVDTKLGDHVIRGKDAFRAFRRQSFAKLALSETSKRRLIVILHNRMYDEEDEEITDDSLGLTVDEVTEKYGFVRRKNTIRNPWHNTRQIDQLLRKNLDLLEEFGDDRRFLLCNQCLATPGVKGGLDALGVVTGSNSLRPVSHACQLYQCGVLDCFLRDNASQPWNIVALDFIELCPELMDFLIGLNYGGVKQSACRLTVQVAAVSDGTRIQDVTAICQDAVRRNCVLFLVDPHAAFGLDQRAFKFMLGYTLQGKEGSDKHLVAELNVQSLQSCDAFPILLSPFSCNSSFGCLEINDSTTKGIPKGIVHEGQILTKQQGLSSDEHDGLTVSFAMSGSGCEFKLS